MRTLLLAVAALAIGAGVVPAEVEVSVTSSYRLVPHNVNPDPFLLAHEGGVETRLSAAVPIDVVSGPSGLERVDDRTFRYIFAWDETGPYTAEFTDGVGAPTSVVFAPEPPRALDPSAHQVPVLHVRTAPEHLWDPDTGIYVWGTYDNFNQHGSDWERPAELAFYDGGTTPVFEQPVGLRIHGGWSRHYDQKGLRFYFDHEGPPYELVYDVFDGAPTTFERLIVKTNRYAALGLKTNVAEGVFADLGHLASRARGGVLYLNDEYWGTYTIRERIDEEFIETTHDLADDDYIMVKDCGPEHGDDSVWHDFLYSLANYDDYESHARYAWLQQNLDMVSYVDWMAINIFGATSDNVHCGNLILLKLGAEPWRYVVWDEDGVFQAANLDNDHFRWFSSVTEADYELHRPPAQFSGNWNSCRPYFRLFASLMRNSEFKAYFRQRFETLLATELSVASLQARIDAVDAAYQPEKAMQAERWDWYGPQWWDDMVAETGGWITARHPIVTAQLASFMELHRVPVELSSFSATAADDDVRLAWRTESEEGNDGFLLERRVGDDGAFETIAQWTADPALVGAGTTSVPTGYVYFDEDAPQGVSLAYRLSHQAFGGQITPVDWVESVFLADYDGLTFSEVMADNDAAHHDAYGEADDWFEIRNAAAAPVDLGGCWVSDDPTEPLGHRLPAGLVVPAGGRLVLWADDEVEQGDDHVAFKLSSGGESLVLTSADGVTIVDRVTFPAQIEDHVYMRHPATGDWTYGWTPTPGLPNAEPQLVRFLELNEIMPRNGTTVADGSGDHDPWLEIRNRLPAPLLLEDLKLVGSGGEWPLPATDVPADARFLVWLDDEPEEGDFHAALTVDPAGDSLRLSSVPLGELDSVTWPGMGWDEAFARIPEGDDWIATPLATPGAPNPATTAPLLVINEFLASNDTGLTDETGACEDWLEIHNPGAMPVALGGMTLSDDLGDPEAWTLPDVTLPPRGFLVVWCDDDPEDGPLHAEFKLSAGGEEIGLWHAEADGGELIDAVVFGPQTADVSWGRRRDAELPWVSFAQPTPGAPNNGATAVTETPEALRLDRPYPNPFNPATTLEFSLARSGRVRLDLYDARGERVRRLLSESMTAGLHRVVWRGRDDAGRKAPSGLYFARLTVGEETLTRRLVLVR